ncbi:MAG TPA: hypothetical protein VF520_08255 [Thermoleophilaceae bacterium]
MNAVNLLPAKHRPRTPTGGQQGSAYFVIGGLGALLLAVLLYVVTVNGINTRKDSVARAKAETAQAEARARDLSAYGNFKQVKEQRLSSVKQAATGRIDWERLARGLAHVLPEDVWLLSASASATGQPQSTGSQGSSPSGGAATKANDGPTLVLSACARSHPEVAVALVRLRHLAGVEDVSLNNIQQPETTGTPANPTANTSGGGGSSSGSQDCGTHGKNANYKFDVTVAFKPNPGSTQANGKVPASLGGGS